MQTKSTAEKNVMSFRRRACNLIGQADQKFSTQIMYLYEKIKDALSGLRQFLAIERSLKVIKNAFYFTSKSLFVLKVFEFLS